MYLNYFQPEDKPYVMKIEPHINEQQYAYRLYTKTGYIIWKENNRAGLMYYSVLWDNLPFLNLIFIEDKYRKQGIGTEAMQLWEADMKKQNYKMVLISTQVDEDAQHFYRKLGYIDCGALLLDGTPLDQPMEMFMRKVL